MPFSLSVGHKQMIHKKWNYAIYDANSCAPATRAVYVDKKLGILPSQRYLHI